MSQANASPAPERLTWRMIVSLLSIDIMILMCSVDVSAVNISLKSIMEDLNSSLNSVQWVVISYMLAIACLLLQFARLGDLRNKKTIFFSGVALFTAASMACGLAPSAGFLIAARVFQGIGAAMCQSLAAAIISEIAGPKFRGRAMGLFVTFFSVGLMVGPSVGSLCVYLWDWRAIFFINVPLGAVALFCIIKFVPQLVPPYSEQKFDIPGAILTTVALGSYSLALTMAQLLGFSDRFVIILFCVAAVGLFIFIQVEKRVKFPMIELSLFKNPVFTLNLSVNFLSFIGSTCNTILPLYLMQGRGFSVQVAGFFLMIMPCAIAFISYFSGWMADTYGTRIVSYVGLVIQTAGLILLTGLDATTPWWSIALRALTVGIGVGIFQSANNSSIIGAAPREALGVASGLLTYTRVLGQGSGMPLVFTAFAIGAAKIAPVVSDDFTKSTPQAIAAGISTAYTVVAAILVACLILAAVSWKVEADREKSGRA